jgi:hypothetical protein
LIHRIIKHEKNKTPIIDLTSSSESENMSITDLRSFFDSKKIRELIIDRKIMQKQNHNKIIHEQIDLTKSNNSNTNYINKINQSNSKSNNSKIKEAAVEISFINLIDSSENTDSEKNDFFNINKINIESKREKAIKQKEIITKFAYSNQLNHNNSNTNNRINLNLNHNNANIIFLESTDNSAYESNSSTVNNNSKYNNLKRNPNKENTLKLIKKKRNRTRKNKGLEDLNIEMTKFCFDSKSNKKRASSNNLNKFLTGPQNVIMKKEKEKLINNNPQNIFMIENFPEYFRTPVFKKFYLRGAERKKNSIISIYLTNAEIPICASIETTVKDSFYAENTKFKRENKSELSSIDSKKEVNFTNIKKKRISARQLAKFENEKKIFNKSENKFYEKFGMKKVSDSSFASQEIISN